MPRRRKRFRKPGEYGINPVSRASGIISRARRKFVADRRSCEYCGDGPLNERAMTVDHAKPRSKGGFDKLTNFVPACSDCNSAKGNMPLNVWLKIVATGELSADVEPCHANTPAMARCLAKFKRKLGNPS